MQPLSGEYGGRRSALEQLPFYSGYGVETGLLIGVYEKFGLNGIAQVDLLERIHHNQSLEALSKMSFAILQTVVRKLEQRYHLAMLEDVNKSMKLIRHKRGTYFLDVEEIAERERPPMIEVADYRKWMKEDKSRKDELYQSPRALARSRAAVGNRGHVRPRDRRGGDHRRRGLDVQAIDRDRQPICSLTWSAARLSPLGGWTVLLVPTLGGLIVGVLMYLFVGEERHHGVAGIMEAVALAGGRLRYKRIPIKTVAASISIGAGASVGPEDPSVQIGANLGSFFGQVLRQSDDRTRTLVAAARRRDFRGLQRADCGHLLRAGIDHRRIERRAVRQRGARCRDLGRLHASGVGAEPAFHVPTYEFNSPLELPLYLALGVLAGIVSALYIRAIYKAHDIFHELKAPRWVKPAIAGVIVGVVGIFLPQIFGVGYSTIEQILNGQTFSLGLLIALLIAKLILTPVSIGGGFPGGVFAPSLFLGATLGAAFGSIVQLAIPGYPIVPAAFAMVGMAAVLAGAVHAPLTAIILLFEMTNDYRIILPLMFAVVVSLIVSQRLAARLGLCARAGAQRHSLAARA